MEGGGYVIPAESTIVFEVHADIASYPSNSLVQARFDTGSSVTYVEAEELDDGSSLSGIKTNGTCASTCDITVTTTASSEWTLVSQGDLYVTKDSTSTGNRQFLGGDLGKSALRLQFRANNEDIDVTDIRLTSSGGVANEVDVLELYKDDESTPFVLATRNCPTNALTTNPAGHGTVKSFCADMEDGQLIVPEGENVDVVIRPRMKSDVNGGASNAVIQFLVNEHESVTDNSSGAILARGYESSNDLSASNHDATEDGEVFIGINSAAANNTRILGSEHVSVLAQITSIANANPDANGSAINTGLLPFGQFSFTAADNANSWAGYNDAVLSGLLFNVNATNVEMTYNAFKIYEKGVTASKKTCTAYRASDATPLANAASGALLIDCNGLVADAVNTEIDPGETLTLVLEGDVVRTNITANATSTLQAQLQNFNLKARTTYGESATDTKSHIQWLDQDDGVDGTFTWVEYPDSAVGSTSYRS
jgi:hypothetical protein